MIKTIIFDLGGVIVSLDFKRGYESIAPLCGCPAEELPAKIASTGLVEPLECGKIAPEDFASRIIEFLGLDMDYEQFCEVWDGIFLPGTIVSEELIVSLKQHYRLLLLSNTNAIHFPYILEKYPVMRHFEDYILSYDVGVMKPERKIYEVAVERAACEPGECFFTDDVMENVEGARRAGLKSEQFVTVERLEADLHSVGVRV